MAEQPPKSYHSGELSPDSQHYWDGQQWLSAVSPDGSHRWDGNAWVPNIAAAPPATPATAGTPGTKAPAVSSARSGFPRWLLIAGFILFLPITGLVWVWRRAWTPKVKWAVTAGWVVVWGIAFAVNGSASSSPNTQSASATSSNPKPTATQAGAAAPSQAPVQNLASTPTPTPKPATPTPTPKPVFATFHDGIHKVGAGDIQPGTYRTRSGSTGCYFARLKGFGNSVDDIIANENTNGPAVVTIAATDAGFQSQNCATWTADLSQVTKSQTSFGEGTFIVGTDIQPGTYKSTGGQGCYYARLKGFGGSVDDIAANNNTDAPAIVTVDAGDKGFISVRCGTWTKV